MREKKFEPNARRAGCWLRLAGETIRGTTQRDRALIILPYPGPAHTRARQRATNTKGVLLLAHTLLVTFDTLRRLNSESSDGQVVPDLFDPLQVVLEGIEPCAEAIPEVEEYCQQCVTEGQGVGKEGKGRD